MDRKILKQSFTAYHIPDWVCPTCEKGTLILPEGNLNYIELADSRDHTHEAWEPEWIEYSFSTIFRCSNPKCQEAIACGGKGKVDWGIAEDADGLPYQEYEECFQPHYFYPPLKLFSIPKDCPADISEPIERSFELFFCSASSAANCVRIAIEELITHLKVKRYRVVNSNRRMLSLHERIGLLPGKYAEIRDIIYAIKWLGNTGSHKLENLSHDDVLDAYEFLQHVLQEIFEQKSAKLKAKAKAINKKKGPSK